MYDIRHPLGSIWRVVRDRKMATKRPTPAVATKKQRIDRNQRPRPRAPDAAEGGCLVVVILGDGEGSDSGEKDAIAAWLGGCCWWPFAWFEFE